MNIKDNRLYLEHKDLVRMICGTWPDLGMLGSLKGLCSYNDSSGRMNWDKVALQKMSREDLINLYIMVDKNALDSGKRYL